MSETRHEFWVRVRTRAVNVEVAVEVFGARTPKEAEQLLRDALKGATLHYSDPAVEG